MGMFVSTFAEIFYKIKYMSANVNLKQVLTYRKNDIQLEWDGNDERRMGMLHVS